MYDYVYFLSFFALVVVPWVSRNTLFFRIDFEASPLSPLSLLLLLFRVEFREVLWKNMSTGILCSNTSSYLRSITQLEGL